MEQEELHSLLEAAAPLIDLAIAEDIGPGDCTSSAVLPPGNILAAGLIVKAPGVIAGLPIAAEVFRQVDPAITFEPLVKDGQEVVAGELIARVSGPGRSLLAAERIMLNFLQRLSGVATLTRRFVEAVACTNTGIMDTRKTTPGYRRLEKYAVRMGGGLNHRMSLYDALLVKDNHLEAAGCLSAAVEKAHAAYPLLPLIVEVRTLDELQQALDSIVPIHRILLDNMDLATMSQAVQISAGRVPLEASGGATLTSVAAIAETGVDVISVGALTHSAPALDISLEVGYTGPAGANGNLSAKALQLKKTLNKQVVILGHHYQRDEVIALADYTGDSLKLARDAARQDKPYIVFCGVHFMAETAAILAAPGQRVLIPDPEAGCYLADTAAPAAVETAWEALNEAFGDAEEEFTPITYVNSSAALKAFCGRHGGTVCTSGNAEAVLRWALARRPRLFFFPDQHLGRNTARLMGIRDDAMLLWNTRPSPTAADLRQAQVLLWPGACSVHQRFHPEHVLAARQKDSAARIIVHPECRSEVVELADEAGSTARMIERVRAAAPGTHWIIGTESRLVNRLQRDYPEQSINSLADVPPYCHTMGLITLEKLVRVLEGLTRGELINEVTVDPQIAQDARLALQRMLDLP
jgi:quinolinate synthase